MPRAREDDLCGLYCPKLLAIALITSANFFFFSLDWGEKIVPWCKMGNGKPLVPCTQCSCCSLWSPTSARACGCSGVPEVTCAGSEQPGCEGSITAGSGFLTKPGIWHDSRNAAASFSSCFWSCTSSLLDSGKRTPGRGKKPINHSNSQKQVLYTKYIVTTG